VEEKAPAAAAVTYPHHVGRGKHKGKEERGTFCLRAHFVFFFFFFSSHL
jgi:hypothetical protein